VVEELGDALPPLDLDSRVRRPSAASATASAAATVVLPVPPLPVTTCRRDGQRAAPAGTPVIDT
jgi:hypothetical protein